jgi:hypothetical protein
MLAPEGRQPMSATLVRALDSRHDGTPPAFRHDLDGGAPRVLGIVFLVVVATSLISGLLHDAAVGSGSMTDILVHVSTSVTVLRLSILGELITSVGIMTLAGLLYVVLSRHNRIVASVALGLWLAGSERQDSSRWLWTSSTRVLRRIPPTRRSASSSSMASTSSATRC